jgi:hypothetical protein
MIQKLCAAGTLLAVVCSCGGASPAAGSPATLARIKASMKALGGRFRDMDTLAKMVVTPPADSADAHQGREMTIVAHLLVKMPDKVRFQVLSSSFPLFNRWTFIQNGNQFAAYDPVSDRYVSTDFRRLTGRDMARVDTKMAFMGLLFDPSRYRISLLGKTARKGVGVYKVRMKLLKPEQLNPLTYLSYTDMYVDTVHYAPVASESYDTAGRLATSGDFREPKMTPAGWAPTRITVTDREMEHYRARRLAYLRRASANGKVADRAARGFTEPPPLHNGSLDLWITWSGPVLYPHKMIARPPVGGSTQWEYSHTRVNTGMADGLFRLK